MKSEYEKETSANSYDGIVSNNGAVPEIDTTHYASNATDTIPDEVPRREEPGHS